MARPKTIETENDSHTTRRRRGGRKPGKWTLLTPEKLRAWRDMNKVSRARLAQMLGVSSTSVQNWETGTVASMKIQQRLAELIAAGPAVLLPPRTKTPSLWDGPSHGHDAVLAATGAIASQYAQSTKNLSRDDLVTLVCSVRQALG